MVPALHRRSGFLIWKRFLVPFSSSLSSAAAAAAAAGAGAGATAPSSPAANNRIDSAALPSFVDPPAPSSSLHGDRRTDSLKFSAPQAPSESYSPTARAVASHTISVFWDLDNKPPRSVPPYDAAIRLREIAMGFGRVVDMVAYANRHAFSYLPSWVKEQRRERKALDALELSGLVVPDEPYICGYCGRKCKTHVALKKHFKQLHERERNKRMSRLDCFKGKRKQKYKDSLAEKETKYKEAAKNIIVPKVGYGLAQELKRAGVWVRTVSDKPQAADEALKKHITESIEMGIRCICIVSDDSDFLSVLHQARARKLHTVVVGDTAVLKKYTDVRFSWADVASGRALKKANEVAGLWYGQEGFVSSSTGGVLELKKDRFGASSYFPVELDDFEDWDSSDRSDEELMTFESDAGWWLEDYD